jgi:YHS domain-containing protein
MQLTLIDASDAALRAGYACPCGCTPSVEYGRGAELAEDGCCCGNHFAVGPHAAASLNPKTGFHPEIQAFDAPWGERLEAAWLVGPSVHGPGEEHAHHHDGGNDATDTGSQAIDPVCGMTVEPEAARAKGLSSAYHGTEYFFCGKGCKLDFDEDPERYLDPNYVPSM